MGKKKAKAEAFVLDCSIAIAWCFHDETNPYADAVAARFPKAQAIVPVIWPLEIANVLLVGERRKRCTAADTAYWLGTMASLPILVDEESTIRIWNDVLSMARTQNLTTYDATYLEVAWRRHLPLATLDDKLKTAADAIGVAEYKP